MTMRSARLAFAAALALGTLAACSASADAPEVAELEAQVVTVDAAELAARLGAGEVQLIDVRTPEEFAQGHIAGAVNMPLDGFDPAALPATADGVETVLYCRSGRRSEAAGKLLSEHSGVPATHLEGGILAWEAAGQPVE